MRRWPRVSKHRWSDGITARGERGETRLRIERMRTDQSQFALLKSFHGSDHLQQLWSKPGDRKIYFDDFSMRSLSLASAQKSALFMAVDGNRHEPSWDRDLFDKGYGKSRYTPERSIAVSLAGTGEEVRVVPAVSSAPRIVRAGTRRNFFAKPTFESIQMIHFVGSNCHGFTPFR